MAFDVSILTADFILRFLSAFFSSSNAAFAVCFIKVKATHDGFR